MLCCIVAPSSASGSSKTTMLLCIECHPCSRTRHIDEEVDTPNQGYGVDGTHVHTLILDVSAVGKI